MAARVKVRTKFDLASVRNVLAPTVEVLEDVGRFSATRIQQFTRSGKTLAKADKPEPLKPLSKPYKLQRAEWVKQGRQLSDFFKVNKSNLQATGQLIDSVTFKIPREKNTVDVTVSGNRRGEQLSNQQLASYVAKQGRPFLGLDLNGIKRIKNIVLRALRRRLKAYNK